MLSAREDGRDPVFLEGYPSDLTDGQWTLVEPLLPAPGTGPKGGRREKHPRRRTVDAIIICGASGSPLAGGAMRESRSLCENGRAPWRGVSRGRLLSVQQRQLVGGGRRRRGPRSGGRPGRWATGRT
nr:transposase [Actinacidiphila oryziradicis]